MQLELLQAAEHQEAAQSETMHRQSLPASQDLRHPHTIAGEAIRFLPGEVWKAGQDIHLVHFLPEADHHMAPFLQDQCPEDTLQDLHHIPHHIAAAEAADLRQVLQAAAPHPGDLRPAAVAAELPPAAGDKFKLII